MEKAIVIGAGFSGATMARLLAEKGVNVTVVDKCQHIGGTAYDRQESDGIIVQPYGPHVFHTEDREVFDFLSRFTEWNKYKHRVSAVIKGKTVPIPFNLNSLFALYPKDKADRIKRILIREVGLDKRVPIFVLLTHFNDEVREFAKFVYDNVYKKYTKKQWGMRPEDIGESVINRVPVYVSERNDYYDDEFQVMPKKGFTELIANMLCHPKIRLKLGTDATRYLALYNGKVYWQGKEFNGDVFYTGKIDELFRNKYGALGYRTSVYKFKEYKLSSYQNTAVVNCTVHKRCTRITEFTKFTSPPKKRTVIAREYSKKYRRGDVACFPVLITKNLDVYEKYKKEAKAYPKLHLLGRLPTYKLMNMSQSVKEAFNLFNDLTDGE